MNLLPPDEAWLANREAARHDACDHGGTETICGECLDCHDCVGAACSESQQIDAGELLADAARDES